jgi:predicted GNAT family N-acyltransferase
MQAIHITARVEGRLTGAVRLNENSVSAGLEGVLQTASLPKPFIYCSRLYVLEEFRGKGVMQELSSACFEQFYERSSAVAICHCYKHLFKLYSRMGFRSYGTPFELPSLEHLGTQTPLVCVMGERGSKQAA